MYKKGWVRITSPPCAKSLADPDGECFDEEHAHSLISYPLGLPPVAFLPHSCDEWIIGGPEQIQDLISDLQAALAKMG